MHDDVIYFFIKTDAYKLYRRGRRGYIGYLKEKQK
jgi:hypothetical protein